MRFVLFGILLAAGLYLAFQSSSGQAFMIRTEATIGRLVTNIVGNLSR